MKKILVAFFALFICLTSYINAQSTEGNNGSATLVAESEKPVVVTPAGKEVIITFKNMAEKSVAIFAGPKENIREPRIFTYGGLSKNNKLYMRENEVVCLMTADKRPVACTVVKPGVTVVEVNVSANGISSK